MDHPLERLGDFHLIGLLIPLTQRLPHESRLGLFLPPHT